MIYLPEQVKIALNQLHVNGYEAFVVGGCVRDALIGREIHDFDITTNALPTVMKTIFKDYPTIETGIKHGTLTIIIQYMPIEITTYRIDGSYSDNRRPDRVEFTQQLKEDLKRRDFTMNALAYNESSGLIDFFNGKKDIEEKRIRCVGEPDIRFEEDALRILRSLRFASVLGFSIEEKTSMSIHKNKERLKHISTERITSEFSKMLCGKCIDDIFHSFSHVIATIDPEFSRFGIREHSNISQVPSILHLRLSYFFLHILKGYDKVEREDERAITAKKIMQNMRFDKETINKVYSLLRYYEIELILDERYVKKRMNQLTPRVLKEILWLKSYDPRNCYPMQKLKRMEEIIDEILSNGICYSIKDLAISGAEILKLGVLPGKIVGETLDYLLEKVIEGKVTNAKDELLSLAKKYLNEIEQK